MCTCCSSFKEHIQGITFISPTTRQENKREQKMSRDHDAYRRLRREGLQPKSLKDVARVEANADSTYEIEKNKVLTTKQQKARRVTEKIMDDTGVGKVIGSGLH